MNEPNLLIICVTGFLAVMLLLSILAGVIRILTALFPEAIIDGDPAVLAAISATVTAVHPGSKVTAVEEIR